MAGKFVAIEEAARLLGVGVDEVKRLVERKKLFPLLDGKFKVDEIERVRASLGDDSSMSGSLGLDLDLADDAGGELTFDEPVAGSVADAGSQTIVREAAPAGSADGLSGLALSDEDDDTVTDSGDLVLEANPGASSPSLARPSAGSFVGSADAGDPLTLDMSNISIGPGSAALAGSQLTGAPIGGLSGASAAGSGFSSPADSGLSLEDGGLQVSGIDLDTGAGASPEADAGASLAGAAFDLGGDIDEDSASVVIQTDDSGDSSFFGNVEADSSASVAIESSGFESSGFTDSSSIMSVSVEPSIEMRFSGWQTAGLICCTLILLFGGIIMYDLLSEIHKPQGSPNSGLLLDAVGHLMGWRR